MPHNPLSPQLELLVPWDLPTQTMEGDREAQAALLQLLQALHTDNLDQAMQWVNQAMAELSSISTHPAQVTTTKLPLKYWEIEDFDTYFNVCHIQTAQPAIALVKGLLQTCYIFLQTVNFSTQIDNHQVNLQRLGFIAYAQLLLRMVNQTLDNTV